MLSSVWVIEFERGVRGVWSTPEKAVRAYFRADADDRVVLTRGSVMSVEAAVAQMTVKGVEATYPWLTEVRIDSDRPMIRDF